MINCAPAVDPIVGVADLNNQLSSLKNAVDVLNNAVSLCTTSLSNASKSLNEILSEFASKTSAWLSINNKDTELLDEQAKKEDEILQSIKSEDSPEEDSPADNDDTAK